MALNLRHKLALCATLVCVGLIVLLGGGTRAALSIGVLGIAFSWAFGSSYRIVHWLFVIFGLLLLVPAVGDAILWPRTKPELVKNQIAIIENDKWLVQLDNNIGTHDGEGQDRRRDRRELGKDYAQLLKDEKELPSLQAESLLARVIEKDWETLVAGFLLLSAGLGLVVGVKTVPDRRNEDRKEMREG